ncbi:galectin-4-like isoform 2-T2 [Pholidichthys leucotaenia]
MYCPASGYQPISNPKIPYLGPIHGGLKDGSSIFIQGEASEDMTRFFVNLLCGKEEDSDVALHINPRFDGWDKVVFNTRAEGSWQSEDKVRSMPFTKGKNFELVIEATSDCYQVKVDGKDFHTYKHRLPVKDVCAMHISGDVSIQSINVVGGGTEGGNWGGYPGGKPGYPGGSDWGCPGGNPLKIPYLGPICGGLKDGSSICIEGKASEDMTRFFVNLLCGKEEDSNIALHINPRFDGWDKVVFNTRENGTWQSEDKVRCMPFTKGKSFELVIKVTSDCYQIKVDGKDFHTFEHRLPLKDVRAMQISGDVSVQSINIVGSGNPGSKLPSMDGRPILNPPVPYIAMVKGMIPKRTIVIKGKVLPGADRFKINFTESRKYNDNSLENIAFHFNPRIKERVVVRNSRIAGKWGEEEREISCSPFKEGEYFEISIRCGNQKFKVYVNERPLCDYNHRLKNFNGIDKLEIAGDVQLCYIHY